MSTILSVSSGYYWVWSSWVLAIFCFVPAGTHCNFAPIQPHLYSTPTAHSEISFPNSCIGFVKIKMLTALALCNCCIGLLRNCRGKDQSEFLPPGIITDLIQYPHVYFKVHPASPPPGNTGPRTDVTPFWLSLYPPWLMPQPARPPGLYRLFQTQDPVFAIPWFPP